MNCERVRVQLSAYLDGDLSADRKQLIRDHLEICDACVQYVRDTKAMEADLAAAAERRARRLTLSPRVSARVQERIYRRMRRAVIMQRVTRIAAGVMAVVAVMALASAAFTYWQSGPGEEDRNGDRDTPLVFQSEPTVITFACPDYQMDEFKNLVRDFEEAIPDVRVRLISADEASGMQRQGSTVTSDGREIERLTAAADTFVWQGMLRPSEWVHLLDLTPYVKDPSFPADDFYLGTLEPYRWKGGIYGIPLRVLPFFVFYDKSMFDAAGVPYPKTGWTWEDLVDAAIQLTQREGGTVQRYGFVDMNFMYTLVAAVHQYGISLWIKDSDPPEPMFERPEVVDVLRRYTDMALFYDIMPVPEVGSNVYASTLISEGKAAIWTDAAFNRAYHARRTELGVVPYPEAMNAANPNTSYGLFVSAGTTHPEAAWRWLSFLSANYQPPREGSLPGRRSVTDQLPWWRELDEETRDVYDYALEHPLAANNLFDWPVGYAAADVFEEGIGVDEALAAAQERALGYQAELALAARVTPQPVAPPPSVPGKGQAVVTFATDSSADVSLYRPLADQFQQQHPDVWVDVVLWPANIEELPVVADCFAGSMNLMRIPEFQANVRSLQPMIDADLTFDLSDFYPQYLTPLRQDGELWALPYEADTQLVYLNLERLAEAEVEAPEPGWSIEAFLDTAVALSGDGKHGFTTRGGVYEDVYLILAGLGAQLWDSSFDPGILKLDHPSVVAALEQYANLSRERDLTPATPSAQVGWPDAAMVGGHPPGVETGEVAMWIDRISYHDLASPLSFETGAVSLPREMQASAFLDVRVYYISAETADWSACWDWLTFLSGRPEVVQRLPARRSVTDSLEWQERVGAAKLSAYRAAVAYTGPSSPDHVWIERGLSYAYPWLYDAFQATVGGQDAENAVAEAQAKVTMFNVCLDRSERPYDANQFLNCAQRADPEYPVRRAEP